MLTRIQCFQAPGIPMRGRSHPAGGFSFRVQTKNPQNDIFLGKKIRFRRKMLKMSQKQLGHALGVSS